MRKISSRRIKGKEMRFTTVAAISLILFSISGCAPKANRVCGGINGCNGDKSVENNTPQTQLNPYQFKFKPIVGSRQDDAKVVVNMGKVQKIWVAPYKTGATMIASHDVYTWVEKPDFVVGEAVPDTRAREGVITPMDTVPFAFKSREFEKNSKPMNDMEVRKYVNNVYKTDNDPSLIVKKNDEADDEFDSTISDYLKKERLSPLPSGEGDKHE